MAEATTTLAAIRQLAQPGVTDPLLDPRNSLIGVYGVPRQRRPGLDAESIEMSGTENCFSFFFCGKVDGFNGFDPERFNDGFHV